MMRTYVLFLITVLLCVACSSAPKVRDMGAAVGTQHDTAGDDVYIPTKQEEEEAEQAAVAARKNAREDEKRRREERTDRSLGTVYASARKYDAKSGRVRVVLRRRSGSFALYALDKKGHSVPIISAADDASASFFSVLIGSKEYRLNKAASIEREVRRKDDGGQIAYTLGRSLQIVLDFSTVASVIGGDDDIIKISVYTTNLAETRQVLALRAVLDTVLGEHMSYHFLSASGKKIDGEKQFTNLKTERYFVSSDGTTTAQFLLEGKTILTPETVSFANRDEILTGLWKPIIKEDRGFNSMYDYSDSALCINWPYFSVEPGETNSFTFYIAVGTDEDAPRGLDFIDTLADDVQKTQQVGDTAEIIVKKPDEALLPITDDKLDSEYIQNLIDRINALSSDPKLVDRTELHQLNAELDAILDRIRQLHQR